jgi:translation initiation factor IF-2
VSAEASTSSRNAAGAVSGRRLKERFFLTKLRVYQVARDFQISSEALLEILRGLNVEVKSHMSTVEDAVIEQIRQKFRKEQEVVKAEDARKREARIEAEKQAREQTRKATPPPPPAPVVADRRSGAPAVAAPPGRPPASGPPSGPPSGPRRKDKKKKRSVDDRQIRESVRKTVAAMDAGRGRARRRRFREDGSVVVEDEKVVRVNEFITISELADHLEVKPTEVIAACMRLGVLATINQRLDRTTIEAVADEFGFGVEFVEEGADAAEEVEEAVGEERLEWRPPVITIMGHVDHGKTSLLDYIRRTNVVAGEVGGITQHIGAYEVTLDNGQSVTFLDTPGHEAFTTMRARGAQATDIVVLVVAADSRVMPQTIEAINHAKAADVPIIVAINKIDLPEANPLLIKQELAGHGILVEEYGGKTLCAEISAKKGIGVDALLDMILLQAEILELKADPHKPATGVVIESRIDKGRGIVATVLVQEGTLRVGDPFFCGTQYGKVRALSNERGQRLKEAGPSTPVEVLGWSGPPEAGDIFSVRASEQQAREIAMERSMRQREAVRRRQRVSLVNFHEQIKQGEQSELPIVLKADVAGSVEVLSEQLQKLGNDQVRCKVIHAGVGLITESDVNLAVASNGIVIGFHVRPEPRAADLARREKVDIHLYDIIYEVIEQVKSALSGLLKPEEVEEAQGTAEVRQVFSISKAGTIAGCMVTNGTIMRTHRVRLRRDGEVVFDGRLSSLKRFKDDVKEVAAGFECGIALDGHNDVRPGDLIEAYTVKMVARVIE